VVFAVCVYRQAPNVIICVFIGKFKCGITPRDSIIRQVDKGDFILVGSLGVIGYLVR
jgi:hypothetical protein